ncbi:AAA family ATPase [Novosphingobium sp. FSW06-99]|uniref:AAA family ATPase n=1 Tax=Novosphingobium sp. FSW06-99 TaxID=1739113 RepID=UPI0009EB4D00|nr:AAA family ATPase [Novosphingobium sp. FSW06-99]
MSRNQNNSKLRLKGDSRQREIAISTSAWGARGLSKAQAKALAITLNEQINVPPLGDEKFTEAFRDAWSRFDAEEKEEYFQNLHEVEAREPEFLVDPFIPRGALTMLDGHPGQGKSMITTHLAAAVTSGKLFAKRYEVPKGRVLFMAPEDDADRVLRPRLEAQGANLAKIRFMANLHPMDEKGRALLRKELLDYPPELAIIDPLPPFMSEETNTYKATEVRSFMQPLALLAREMNIAILLVRHLRKGGSAFAIEAGQGSIDFIAAVRSGLIVFPHRIDPNTKVFAHPKANWSKPGPSLTFEIEAREGASVPKIKWLSELSETADQLMQAEAKQNADQTAAEVIVELLAAGPMKASEAMDHLKGKGFSERTIDRAKPIAGVKAARGPGALWSL